MFPSPPDPTEPPRADGPHELVRRIRDLAAAHGMSLRKDGDLAELFATMKLGDAIPPRAFAVVAEVLYCLLAANQQPQAGAEPAP